MHPSMGSHTPCLLKELKCADGPFRLHFVKEKTICPHLSGEVLTGEEGHYELATGCELQLLLHGAMQKQQDI